MNLKKWHAAAILFTIIFGTLNHFFYRWSGQNPFIAPFSAVNESTWEHLKLLSTPMILFSIVEYFAYGKHYDGFTAIRTLSVFTGAFLITAVFYSYSAIAGQNILWADIATFLLAVIASYMLSYYLLKHNRLTSMPVEIAARILMAALIVCFLLFTAQPPHLFLFQDPVTGQYGL